MESTKELDKMAEIDKKIRDSVYQESETMKICLNEGVMIIKKLIKGDKLDDFVDVSGESVPDYSKQFIVAMAVQMATKMYEKI